jgi:nucleoside phosphorylase/HEAT repeat protein
VATLSKQTKALLIHLKHADEEEINETLETLLDGSEALEQAAEIVERRFDNGSYFLIDLLASLVAHTKSESLYMKVRQQLFEDDKALLILYKSRYPDPIIEETLGERLYKIASKDEEPRRREIVNAMCDVGSNDVLPILETIQFNLASTIKDKQVLDLDGLFSDEAILSKFETISRAQFLTTVANTIVAIKSRMANSEDSLSEGQGNDLSKQDITWNGPIPLRESKGVESQMEAPIDVILLTAVKTERDAVLRLLRPLPHQQAIWQVRINKETYYLGQFGDYKAVVTMCEMGISGRGSAIIATNEAIRIWMPKAVIMVGFAYGQDSEKQKIADVLISTQVINLGLKRIGKTTVQRGPRPEPGQTLLNRFRDVMDWKFTRPDGSKCEIRFGPILSEEVLVDDLNYKKSLLEQFPDAIGGEMEGAGVYAAADYLDVEWIIIKGICDWADGHKDKEHQPLAAASATSLVHFVLSGPNALPARRVVIDENTPSPSNLDGKVNKVEPSNLNATIEESSTSRGQWIGIVWNGKFCAYDGPLEHLQLIEDEVFQQSMADEFISAGYKVRLARQDKLSHYARKGYKIVHLTDKECWCRRITQSRQLLIARRLDYQGSVGTSAGTEVEMSVEKQQNEPDGFHVIRNACYSLTMHAAKILIDNKTVIARHSFRTKLNEFLASPARYCFVLGPSGVGKSIAMAVEALRVFDLQWSSLLMMASSFSIETTYKLVCEEIATKSSASTFRQLIRPLTEQTDSDSKGLVIFIDAIEDANPDRIALELSKLHETIGDLPNERLKVVISCRDISWEELKNHTDMPIYQQSALLGLSSITSSVSVELSDFSPAELDSALEEIRAEELLTPEQIKKQSDYHIQSLRELLMHPVRFGHYANLKASAAPSLIQDLTWSILIERSMKELLNKPARACRLLPETLSEQLIRFAACGWKTKARGFMLDTSILKSNLPDMFLSHPEADITPYAALLKAGILVETKTPNGGSNTAFRFTDEGAYYLSMEMERRLTGKSIEEFQKTAKEWLREATNYSPSLDALLAWIDRLADRPSDPRLLNLVELIINAYHFHTTSLFSLVRPIVIASIFEIVKRENLKDFYAFKKAARGIRYSAEAMAIIHNHLKDPNPQVRQLATELVGIHGNIESKRELLNLFADSDEDVRREVYGAFRRIGTPSIEPLIEAANDVSNTYELRSHCLGALRGVGYRDDRISTLISRCLLNADSGNSDLLQNAFFLAAHMRDKGHTKAAAAALRHESLDVVQAAAKYLTELPDPKAFDKLEKALCPQWLSSDEKVNRYWVPRQLIAALMKTDQQKAAAIVLEIMCNAFKGKGEFTQVEVVWAAKKTASPGLYVLIFEHFVSQLADTPERNIIFQATDILGDVWREKELDTLLTVSTDFTVRDISLARLFVDAVAEGMKISEGYRLADKLSQVSDLRTVVKCQAANFIPEATRLLRSTKRWNLRELCDYFWVAGDQRAEMPLLNRLENPISQDSEGWYEKSSLAKALGTCGTKQSWEAVLKLFRTEENILLYFDREALYPLALRKVIRPVDLARVVRDPQYFDGGRTLSLLTLALLNVHRQKDLFVEVAGYSENEMLQKHGVRLLGFTKDPSVATTLIQLLRTSKHQTVKSEAAEALGRLGVRHSIQDIEHALQESPTPGFIKALSQFQESSSLPLILEGIEKGWSELYDDYLTALGAFSRFPKGKEAIEAEIAKWTRLKPTLLDEQVPVVVGLLRHEPSRLLAQSSWLLDNGCLNSNARAELAKSIPYLTKKKEVRSEVLTQTIKRLICDRDVKIRNLTILSLQQVGVRVCQNLYSEITKSSRSTEWDRACAVNIMAVCGNIKQVEFARYDREFLVRRAADEALSGYHKRIELQRHIEQFVMSDGLAKLSAYLCLEEQGDLFSIESLKKKCRVGSLNYTFLHHLTRNISNRLTKEYKERQEKEDKLEQSRGTIWFD